MAALIPELYCSDLVASQKFYVQILGFEILYDRPEHKFIMLSREGAEIMLQEVGSDRMWIAGPLNFPFGRGVSFQIQTSLVDDLYAAVQRSQGLVFLPMEEKWYRAKEKELGSRQFIVQDPDGYLLRFFQDLGQR